MNSPRIQPAAMFPEAVLFAATLPFVLLHFRNLWDLRPHYQFFPVLVAGVIWLTWSRWPKWQAPGRFHCLLQRTLLGCGIAGLLISVLLFSPTLGTAASILLLGTLLMKLTGRAVWHLFPCWLLLWLIVPPPFRGDLRLIQSLQHLVSLASSTVFDALGVTHVMSGNVLDLPGKRLLVEQACSGINSLLALLCAAALFVVAARRPLLRSSLLIVSAVGWALLVNLARVVSIGVAYTSWQVDWSTGWVHDVLGFVLVAIAFLLLVSTDYVLGWLLDDVRAVRLLEAGQKTQVALPGTGVRLKVNPFSYWWDTWVSGVVPARPEPTKQALAEDLVEQQDAQPLGRHKGPMVRIGQALVIGVGIASLIAQTFLVFAPRQAVVTGDLQHLPFGQQDLTGEGWAVVGYTTEQRDRDSDEGALSNIWTVRTGQGEALVSLDYPFFGWHELPNCYLGHGWDIVSRRVEVLPMGQGGDVVEVYFNQPNGRHAYLLFSLFADDGEPLTPRISHWRSLSARLVGNPLLQLFLGGRLSALPGAQSLQIQLFLPTSHPLSDAERVACRESFLAYRTELRRAAIERIASRSADTGDQESP